MNKRIYFFYLFITFIINSPNLFAKSSELDSILSEFINADTVGVSQNQTIIYVNEGINFSIESYSNNVEIVYVKNKLSKTKKNTTKQILKEKEVNSKPSTNHIVKSIEKKIKPHSSEKRKILRFPLKNDTFLSAYYLFAATISSSTNYFFSKSIIKIYTKYLLFLVYLIYCKIEYNFQVFKNKILDAIYSLSFAMRPPPLKYL